MRFAVRAVAGILLGTLTLLFGCTSTMQSFRARGLKRAAFELSCPEDKLVLTEIRGSSALGDPEGTVGVEGCGKKAVYVNTVNGWVANTTPQQ